MEINKIILGNCLDVLPTLESNSVDSICCDPPYELGFMGKSWDNTGIAYNKDMWAECLRVLKPGGHLLAFSGTRTYHRMAVAIEDAGFEVRDMIEWVYGSGFPKSLNIGKAVDKTGGQSLSWFIDYILKVAEERGISKKELTMLFPSKNGLPTGWLHNKQHTQGITLEQYHKIKDFLNLPFNNIQEAEREIIGTTITNKTVYQNIGGTNISGEIEITKGTSEWEGWGTALKPAHEPICMARKPLAESTVAQNVLKYGTGGINIDESRVTTEYYLQGSDLFDILNVCQLNNLNSPANNAELKNFQDDTTNAIKRLCSALVSADTLILEKTLGTLQENTTIMDMLCCEEMSVESMNASLNTFTSGKKPTDLYLKIAKYTILTAKKMITDYQISNALVSQLTESLLTLVKKQETTLEGQARFPANLIHDNSEEVRECFPETKSGGGNKNSVNNQENSFLGTGFGGTGTKTDWQIDSGNASRFFKTIMTDSLCTLCCLPFDIKHDTMSVCNNTNVNSAEKSLKTTQATTEAIAPQNATTPDNKKFVQNVRSVGKLCDLCGTYIALVLAGEKPVHQEEEARGQIFITEQKKQILDNALASFVELRGKKDTTPTINNLNLLFGYVFNAIENSTTYSEQEKELEKNHEKKSLIYQAKASKSERNNGLDNFETKQVVGGGGGIGDYLDDVNSASGKYGSEKAPAKNNHPTVKPIALMEYLIKMVTPKGGIVLDPFAGSGSTLVAAKQNGFNYIGIEMTEEYLPIIEARLNSVKQELKLF